MRTRPRYPRRAAATFVEVAIATLFLVLALLPLLDSILSGSRRARADRNRVFATALCASTMERYRLEVPGTVEATLGGHATDPALAPPDAPPGWSEWRGRFTVSPSYAGAGDGTGVLTVEVSWDEGGRARSISMQTVLARTYAPGTP